MSTEPKFSFATTAEDVGTAFATEIRGKNVLITGTSINGLGFEAARVIAKYANLVVITGYDAARLKLSEDAIKQEVPTANIHRLTLNLSSLANVRNAAEEVNSYPEPLHVLIHNAAAAMGPFKLTVDKLENQFATNHVGPFLLTKLLTPKLLAGATPTYAPRVVFVASAAHAFCKGIDLDVLAQPDEAKYQMSDAYFQAKCANILTAIELSRRSKGTLNAYSLHPGLIATNMSQQVHAVAEFKTLGMLGPDGLPNHDKFTWKTIPQGAATTVATAFDPRLDDKPGAYLKDCSVATETVAAHSSDPANAEKLWTITEEIIGETFTF
ncbi:hypothetical protein B0H17DRAFT_309181 [Mycena rosella]|uniref:Short-chain dehydrogenase/reductase family protein n=1 Tax=Mycena rosella TaxID=1033263 RepID=A0AAD7G653_MYCRO|nr:hypothetical protein B0H17DRAFT_309181 [Mycena rosella]